MAGEYSVSIPCGAAHIEGALILPPDPAGIVLFAHGSGSSRFSPRNNYVADVLRNAHLGTVLIDLLTVQENQTYQTRFDIALLTQRLQAALDWLEQHDEAGALPVGLFGASTGAAAALQVAALPGSRAQAVVSRGGRPDLAGRQALGQVQAPTLLIVGGLDDVVIGLNQDAYAALQCEKQLAVVPGATHLFEEPGTLEEAARLATDWFQRHLTNPAATARYGRAANQQKGADHESRPSR
jgi:putative phosphoribosyl transferase